jgi:hypothetical protein
MYNDFSDGYDMYDSSFNQVGSYHAGNGYITDVHEFQIFPDGHSYILGLDYETVDMTVYDSTYNPNATVAGAILQELDKDQNVIFEWRSWDYIDITEALHQIMWSSFIDYVHANSVEEDADGNILLSCRHLDQVIKIDRNTGNMIWRLGGVKNEFQFLDDPLGFNYQHDVRRISNGDITLFDNGTYHPLQCSYAREYRLDEQNKTATLVWSYKHPLINNQPVYGNALGSVQRLPNGNTLINWGYIGYGLGFPNLTEVTPRGAIAWEMTLDDRYQEVIYRAHRFEWSPCARPTGKLKSSDINANSAKVSWEAATGAIKYLLQYRSLNANSWNTLYVNQPSANLEDLVPSSTYQWRVQSICDSSSGTTSAYSTLQQFTTPALKFTDQKLPGAITIYPNPAENELNIRVNSEAKKFQVRLINNLGIIMYKSDVAAGSNIIQIALKDLAAGVYTAEVSDESNHWMEKVIVQ